LKEVPEIALEETTQKNRVLLIGHTICAQNGEISCRGHRGRSNRHTSVGPEGVVMLKAVVIVAVVVMIVVIVVIVVKSHQYDGPYVKWQETIECGGPG